MFERPFSENCQMFVQHATFIGKVARCPYIIPPSQGRLLDVRMSYHLHRKDCYMFLSHTTFIGRLLDVPISYHLHRKGCQMFVYHTNFIGKVVRCSYIIPPPQGRLLDVRTYVAHYIGDTALIHFKISMKLLFFYLGQTYYISKFCKH